MKFKLKVELDMNCEKGLTTKNLQDVKRQLVDHLPVLKDYFVSVDAKCFTISCTDVRMKRS